MATPLSETMESQSDLEKISLLNNYVKLGFHVSKSSSKKLPLFQTFSNFPLPAAQVYLGNRGAYAPPTVSAEDILETRKYLYNTDTFACVHGCLLYNLAGAPDHKKDARFQIKLDGTCRGLITELDISAGLGCGVVVHTGSCKDKTKGVKTICESINHVLTCETPLVLDIAKTLNMPVQNVISNRKIILENCAGEGSKLGATLDEFATILSGLDKSIIPQVKICFDTAHGFGAGQYDMGDQESIVKFYEDFEEKIGMEKLECFHFNDSRVPFGSKKDRHENIGRGFIFNPDINSYRTDGLKLFLSLAQDFHIPLIGEPPKTTSTGNFSGGGIFDYDYVDKICKTKKKDRFVCE